MSGCDLDRKYCVASLTLADFYLASSSQKGDLHCLLFYIVWSFCLRTS
jgi:hypothetical protein